MNAIGSGQGTVPNLHRRLRAARLVPAPIANPRLHHVDAGQKQRSNQWWSIVRSGLADGSLPELESWEAVRRFVSGQRGPRVSLEDARREWSAYTARIRKLESGRRNGVGARRS